MAVPGKIADLELIESGDDFLVRMTLESGEVLEVSGRSVYDPPVPFAGVDDLFGFLIMQDTPVELIDRELGRIDPDWEAAVEARRRSNDAESERRRVRQADVDLVLRSLARADRLSDGDTVRLGRWLAPASSTSHVSFPDGTPFATVIVHHWTGELTAAFRAKIEHVLGPFESETIDSTPGPTDG